MGDYIKRKSKEFLSNKFNIALVVLLLALFIFRMYWAVQIGNQPLWWDEAAYMNTAQTWLGINDSWNPEIIRPVLLPLILSGFMLVGLGEGAIRFFLLLFSIASVPFLYGIAKMLFNRKVAIVSALFLSLFWSFSFYSYRILTDVPVATLWLGTIYFFLKSYLSDSVSKEKTIYSVIGGIFLGLAFLMKFSSSVLVLILVIYILSTEKLGALKNKRLILFFLVSLITVIPYFIYQAIKFGSPIAFFTAARGGSGAEHTFFESLFNQTLFSVQLMHSVFIVLFLIGLVVLLFELFLLFGKTFDKNSRTNKHYFVLLWLLLSLLFFGYVNYGAYIDERYYFIFYPAIFVIASFALIFIYDKIKKYNKHIALFLVFVILAFAAYQHLTHTEEILSAKKDSFAPIKMAGDLVKQNTEKGDLVLLTGELSELTYYTQRRTTQVNSLEKFNEELENKDPKYIIFSLYYLSNEGQQKMTELMQEVFTNQDRYTLSKAYGPYIDQNGQIPIVSVFKINY